MAIEKIIKKKLSVRLKHEINALNDRQVQIIVFRAHSLNFN